MTLVRGFSGFGKCFEHQRWKFKKSKEQEINDGNDYNDAHRAPPSMMVHHGEDVLAQNSDCAPQRLSDKQPLCKAVSWTVEFLVEFDKYYQKQIQISTDGETSRLVYPTSYTLLSQESANPWYTLAPHYDTKQSVPI